MAAYLHQDFDLFGPTPEAAAQQFMQDEPDLARALPDEIDHLMSGASEEHLAQAVADLGCQLPPCTTDQTYRSSLLELAAEARRLTLQ